MQVKQGLTEEAVMAEVSSKSVAPPIFVHESINQLKKVSAVGNIHHSAAEPRVPQGVGCCVLSRPAFAACACMYQPTSALPSRNPGAER